MGSSTSKPDVEASEGETTFFAPRADHPVQFSQDLISQLSSSSSSAPSAARQETLDSHIQSKIQSELAKLQAQESSVREEIERALEKENLEGEKNASGNGGGSGAHSKSLLKDLEELESRTLKLKESAGKARDEATWSSVEGERKKLVECFAGNKETPLNCRAQADSFLKSVASVEKSFVASIQ